MSNRRKLYIVVWVICIALILVVSLINISPTEEKPLFYIPHIDKIVHFMMYTGLSLLGFIYCSILKIKYINRFLYGISLIALGVIIEVVQPCFGRGADIYDVLANTLGVIVGFVIPLLLRRSIFKMTHNNI